jgi:hypothetical protein
LQSTHHSGKNRHCAPQSCALANGTTNSCVKTVGNFRQVRRRAVCGTEILIPDRSGKIQSRLTQSLLRGMGLPEDEARRRTADRGQREGQGHERAKSPYRGLCPRNRKLRKPCSEAAVVASCGSINVSPRQTPARRSAERSRIGSPAGGLRGPFPSSAEGFENFVNAHRSHQPIRRAQGRAGCVGGRIGCP